MLAAPCMLFWRRENVLYLIRSRQRVALWLLLLSLLTHCIAQTNTAVHTSDTTSVLRFRCRRSRAYDDDWVIGAVHACCTLLKDDTPESISVGPGVESVGVGVAQFLHKCSVNTPYRTLPLKLSELVGWHAMARSHSA
ncbi:hypothetical protein BJV78DRAFT_696563 [Lactifluus subvellereus]|nr:hypothetical protein BJV78DRAFT_696563 [Lactifluus subvellereus]